MCIAVPLPDSLRMECLHRSGSSLRGSSHTLASPLPSFETSPTLLVALYGHLVSCARHRAEMMLKFMLQRWLGSTFWTSGA